MRGSGGDSAEIEKLTHRETWKSCERRIAAMFGTVRTPLSGGSSRHTNSDTLHPELYIEIKKRKRPLLRKRHRDAFKKAEIKAEQEGKPLLYVYSGKYWKDLDSFVVMRLHDLLRMLELRDDE